MVVPLNCDGLSEPSRTAAAASYRKSARIHLFICLENCTDEQHNNYTGWAKKPAHSHSTWKLLNRAMPQGSWLGPLTFLVLIDDLNVDCLLQKYVDDTTLTELLLNNGEPSNM